MKQKKKKDSFIALCYYKLAADQGHKLAQKKFTDLNLKAHVTDQLPIDSQRLTYFGNAYGGGEIHLYGSRVDFPHRRYSKEAVKIMENFFLKAASLGEEEAQFKLGCIYSNFEGKPYLAVKYLRLAASQ